MRRREVLASAAVAAFLPAVALAQEAGRIYRVGPVVVVRISCFTKWSLDQLIDRRHDCH
jgi:hypothetical protein